MEEIIAVFRLAGPDVEPTIITVGRGEIRVGRVADNFLALNHPQISRRHMRIYWEDGGFHVEDLKSSNGVWVNNERLKDPMRKRLSVNDVIRAGPYTLTFEQLTTREAYARQMGELNNGSNPPSTHSSGSQPDGSISDHNIQVVSADKDSSAALHPVAGRVIPKPPRQSTRNIGPVSPVRRDRYIRGLPEERSTWLQYLPGIYADPSLDPMEFMGRYLLIFESVFSPIVWIVDNFDLYLSPETAPDQWLEWLASWFDLPLVPELPSERKQDIVRQMGWLYLRRGTRAGMERLLELYFGVKPDIEEFAGGRPCHFTVRLPLSRSNVRIPAEIADQLIASQKPAFVTYTLEIT